MNIIIESNTAELLALKLSNIVSEAIKNKDCASLVISGGSTPKQMLIKLFSLELDWSKVTLYFSDERFVPNTDEDSNYKMVTECMKQAGLVSKLPTLVSYFQKNTSIEDAVELLESQLSKVIKFDAVIIGMGLDGHIASLFPDDQQLQEKLNLDNTINCYSVSTISSPHARISLSLACLMKTKNFYLLIEGEEKLKVLRDAKTGLKDPDYHLPVTALYQSNLPENKVQVFCQQG